MYFGISYEDVITLLPKKAIKQMNEADYDSFFAYLTEEFKDRIINAINDDIYQHRFRRLSPKYLQHKMDKGLHLGFWMATGALRESIDYITDDELGYYAVGVADDIYYSYRKKNGEMIYTPVSLVVRALEFGTENIPARPLFRFTLRSLMVRANFRRVFRTWEAYQKRQQEYRQFLQTRIILGYKATQSARDFIKGY